LYPTREMLVTRRSGIYHRPLTPQVNLTRELLQV